MTAPLCSPSQPLLYIGKAGAMVQLINPDAYYTNILDMGAVAHSLVGGPTSLQRLGRARRHYNITWSARTVDQADQIVSIQAGMLGPGPYFFIDPLWRNVLPVHIAGSGKIRQTAEGLFPTVGAVAYSNAIAPPTVGTGSLPPGVWTWTGAGSASALYLNASAAGILEASAPPCQLNLLPITPAVWLKAVSGTPNVSLQIYFNDISGALVSASTLQTGNLSTSWQRFSGTIIAASIPSTAVAYGIKILSNGAAAPVIHIAAPSGQYINPGSLAVPAWVLGLGVPRMNVVAPVGANAAGPTRRTQGLELMEAA